MGQINCQCQQAIHIQDDNHKFNANKILSDDSLLTPDLTSIQQFYTQVLLNGASGTLSIKISQGQKVTFGTTSDCQQTPIAITNNSFKLQMKIVRGILTVKDCGVGYGVFLFKKKVILKRNGGEMLLSIEQNFLLLRISEAQIVNYTIYGPQLQQRQKLSCKDQYQILVGQTKLLLKRQKQGKEYSLRRQDKKCLSLLPSEQTKIKPQDILRLGTQFYSVQSFTDYIQSSKVVQRV